MSENLNPKKYYIIKGEMRDGRKSSKTSTNER